MNAPSAPLSDLLTNSRVDTWRRCARRHYYRYELGVLPVEEREELFFGSLIHAALEVWWLCVGSYPKAPGVWGAKAMEALFVYASTRETNPYLLAKAEAMILGYHAHWHDSAEDFEVIGVEKQYRLHLINPETHARSPLWDQGGKLDLLLSRRSDGAIVGGEHKTTTPSNLEPTSFYWRKLTLDSQLSGYFDGGAAVAGRPVDEFMYDVLGKPQLRPYKATPVEERKYKSKTGELYANQRECDETPAEYRQRCIEAIAEAPERFFARRTIVRLDGELDDARLDLWQRAAEIREARKANRWPKNPANCEGCPYFRVCVGESNIDNPDHFYRTAQVHPELAPDSPGEQQPKEGQ